MTLVLSLFYEITLGEKSYWYPYLRAMPDVSFVHLWDEHELEMIQDQPLVEDIYVHKESLEQTWDRFQKVLQSNQKIFPLSYHNRDLFMNVYAQVCTRCFGYGTESTAMIPMADNLNHSSVDVSNEMVSKLKHLEKQQSLSYYRIGKFLNDYSSIFSEDQIKENPLNVKGRFNREVFKTNQQALSVKNIRASLKVGKQIWEVPFFKDTFFEDNDSDDEDESSSDEGDQVDHKVVVVDGKKQMKITLKARHGLEYFLTKEKESLQKRASKKRKEAKIKRESLH